MIIYLTKPDIHECIMGGLRHVLMWTSMPDYLHWPQLDDFNSCKKNNYRDKGWFSQSGFCSAKPLLKQNEVLVKNVWNMICWSCCPKGVSLEDWEYWANQPSPACETFRAGEYDNFSNMLRHRPGGAKAESECNIHHKRFLLKVNLISIEIELVAPRIQFGHGIKRDLTEQSLEIDAQHLEDHYTLGKEDEELQVPF